MFTYLFIFFISDHMLFSLPHRFSGRQQRWERFGFFCYCFSAGLLVFLRMVLCALLIHCITYPVALPTLTIDWTGLRHRYVFMFSLIILSPSPRCSGSFSRPLTYNSKFWRWNCAQYKTSELLFFPFLSQDICQQHGLHLITIQNFNEVSAIAALVKNYQQKENIWIKLEKYSQVLLNYFSKKGTNITNLQIYIICKLVSRAC